MHALKEVRDFFNVGKNMTNPQISITAELIVARFWYFKIEDVKCCFRRAMMREKLFDRLDGNIIIGWLQEYDDERTEEAMRISDQKATQALNEPKECKDAVSYEEYVTRLKDRAKTDKKAAELLDGIENPPPQRLTLVSKEERAKREHDFKMWRTFNYLLDKKQ